MGVCFAFIIILNKTRKEKIKKAFAFIMSLVFFLLTMGAPSFAANAPESTSSLEPQVVPKSDKLSAVAQTIAPFGTFGCGNYLTFVITVVDGKEDVSLSYSFT